MRAFLYDLVKMLHTGGYLIDRMTILDAETTSKASKDDETASFTVNSRSAIYRFVVTRERR